MITIPTIQQLYASALSNLEAEYGVTINPLGKSFLRALAAVEAAKNKLLYLAIANLQKNIFVDTADPEIKGGTLERFGRVKIGRNPFPATAGQYELTLDGTPGATIKASTIFKSNDDSLNPGMLFILDNAYIMVGTSDTITVRALNPGVASKLNILDKVTATSPIALVNSIAYVSNEVVEPLDAETIEAYRAAVLNSYRTETQGGAASDYRIWAQDAQGVAVIYPYAKSGAANEINIFVEATVADSIDGKGTPSASLLSDVEDVIEFNPDTTLPLLERGRRPLGVFQIHYLPITVKEVDITITGYVGLTASIQTLLLNAITDLINGIRPFVAAADVLADKNDILDGNRIIAVILAQTPGATFTSVSISIDGTPVSTKTFTDGDIPHLNTITYA